MKFYLSFKIFFFKMGNDLLDLGHSLESLISLNDKNDITIKTMEEEKELPHSELTSAILGCCFEVMKELGPGFLEKVYKNALLIAMRQKGLQVEVERPYEVIFRGKVIGRYNADLVVSQWSGRDYIAMRKILMRKKP
jgi:hypothetical protein